MGVGECTCVCTCSKLEHIFNREYEMLLFPSFVFFLCRLTGPLHVLLVYLYVLHEQRGSFRVTEGLFDTA